MRRAHRRAEAGAPGDAYNWLRDNWYVLERELAALRGTLRAQRDPAGFFRTARVLERAICLERLPVNDETVEQAVNEMGELRHERLSGLQAALRCALVLTAARAAGRLDAPGLGYALGGLYDAGSVDYRTLAERHSTVEAVYRRERCGVYPAMDPDSRASYREWTGRLARRAGVGEADLAQEILARADAAPEGTPQSHVGWFLLHDPRLERARRARGRVYIGSLAAGTLALAALAAWVSGGGAYAFPAAFLLALLPALELIRPLCEGISLAGLPSLELPRMDPGRLSPAERGAVVAVSVLLSGREDARCLRARLEQLYHANRREEMTFCLLADLPASPSPHTAQDEAALRQARSAVEALCAQYNGHFLLFARPRSYSRTQGLWQGRERKRGAVLDLARSLRGAGTEGFTIVGDWSRARRAAYLIALDSDTALPLDSAAKLIATAAHPLNRCYGVIVPFVRPGLGGRTPFERIFSGCGGVSGYDVRRRDLYQDLFGQAVFTGKGILNLGALAEMPDLPREQVLSHDILEGALLGCGFAGEVEVTDAEPQTLSVWLARAHRWVRGDWQNAPFLRKKITICNKCYRFRLKGITRFQLLDNLRRSVTPAAALLCLLCSPLFPAGGALRALALLSVALGPLWAAAGMALRREGLCRPFGGGACPTAEKLLQAAALAVTLPVRAMTQLDAAARALWRTAVSRRRLLEWTTAAQSAAQNGSGRAGWRALWRRYAVAQAFGLLVLALTPLKAEGLLFSLIMPFAAWSGREDAPRPAQVPDMAGQARAYAADMLEYFRRHATSERHGLPPDNVQLSPVCAVAERTSPTNIGFYLLSLLAGRDFGLLTDGELMERVERTVATLEGLEKWNGNLYNWYDTRTLAVLEPAFVSAVDSGNLLGCLIALRQGLLEYAGSCPALEPLARRVGRLIDETDLRPMYRPARGLFSIGFDRSGGALSSSHYDFLMSEARLLSYCAVALGQVPRRHWGALSREQKGAAGRAGLASWTGTMFEYFMPALLLPAPRGSLAHEALSFALHAQRRRVRGTDLPWGISESGYFAFDAALWYQYKAHGVQALGVRRGLDEEMVLSPYSTFLALPFAPGAALRNLGALRRMGLYGECGFYEAVDCTPARAPRGPEPVRSFMAHHVGMSVCACANAALDGVMQRRFLRDARMAGARDLLEEERLYGKAVHPPVKEKKARPAAPPPMSVVSPDPTPLTPRVSLLASGGLCEVLTDCGAGWLLYAGSGCTPRPEDLPAQPLGIHVLCDCEGETLGAGAAPLYGPGQHTALFTGDAVRYTGQGGKVRAEVECFAARHPEASVRALTFTSRLDHSADVTGLVYFEPALIGQEDFSAHPSYARLFVCGEWDESANALIFTRRKKSGGETFALCAGFLEDVPYEFETDKLALTGAPLGLRALEDFASRRFTSPRRSPDAVCAVRFTMRLSPGESRTVRFALCPAGDAGAALAALTALRGAREVERAPSPLLDHSAAGSLGLKVLPGLLFPAPMQEPSRKAAAENGSGGGRDPDRGAPGLWSLGLSGDLPIALLPRERAADMPAARAWAELCALLRRLGLPVDVVMLCADEAAAASLKEALGAAFAPLMGARGGVHPLAESALSERQRTLLYAAARFLSGQEVSAPAGAFRPARILPAVGEALPDGGLHVYGGVFEEERFICDPALRRCHAPYSHVLANPAFGTLVTDRSLGFTWAVNARECRLTPWCGGDPGEGHRGERLLLRVGGTIYDLIDGARAAFSPQGACYAGRCGGVRCRVEAAVPPRGMAKVVDVTLEAGEALPVQLAYYIEPVLGVTRRTARFLTGEALERGLVLRNAYNTAIPAALAMTTDAPAWRHVLDRGRFLSGAWDVPGELPEADPCAALIVSRTLAPGQKARVRFVLGGGFTGEAAVRGALLALERRTPPPRGDFVRIDTPNRPLNAFVNTLLPAQAFASRLRGRTGFYQCSGAYGFRDQLQDAANLCLLDPAGTRVHLARCCAAQFLEGDVLHWWHALPGAREGEPMRRAGVRTRYSDDLLWLPLAIARYVEQTGDRAFLQKEIVYLQGEELREEEHDRYFVPEPSGVRESVYRHGLRALARGDRPTARGLARIGGGDWNDGFSAVGPEGRGESVWLTQFLALVCGAYAAVCEAMGDEDEARRLRRRADALREAVDRHAWDGAWYRRATFDSGAPMGAARNAECRIDSLPQSFAVLAGMPDRERVDAALESAVRRLVSWEDRIVRLFDPPFERSVPSPGYVQAYPPGIRENGGQYTHAAVWLAQALLRAGRSGEGERVLDLLCPAARPASQMARYRLEPYAMTADVYTNPALYGRGGWSMYTGAAGWFWRCTVEELLGLRMENGRLTLRPALPPGWEGARLSCWLRGTWVEITLRRGTRGMTVDGVSAPYVPLDGGRHVVTA